MDHFNISCSEKAKIELKKYLEKYPDVEAIRLSLAAGGCNGYSVNFEGTNISKGANVIKDSDYIFTFDNIKIIVDPKSMEYLDGTEIEFNNSLNMYGFTFKIPRQEQSCSCGSSIAFKE